MPRPANFRVKMPYRGGLITSITVKIFTPHNTRAKKKILTPPQRGTGWNSSHIDQILHNIAEDLEKRYPGHEYRMVPIGPKSFNFIWVAESEVAEALRDGSSEVGVQGNEQGAI